MPFNAKGIQHASVTPFDNTANGFPSNVQDVQLALELMSVRHQATVSPTANITTTFSLTTVPTTIFTGTTVGQIVNLGDALTYQVGRRYEIFNNSTQSIAIKDFGGNLIKTLGPQERVWLTLKENVTQNGVWLFLSDTIAVGAGNGSSNFGYQGNANVGRWLELISNNPSNNSPLVIAGTKIIRSLSMSADSSATCTVTVLKNSVALTSISLTAQKKNSTLNLGFLLNDLDEISVQLTSGSASRPTLTIWM